MTLWKTAAFTPEHAGWIPPEDRTAEMRKADKRIMDAMPTVDEVFTGSSTSKRPRMWQVVGEAIKRGLVKSEFVLDGKWLKNISQIIGSCVGFGAGNMDFYASIVDAMIRNQREQITPSFVPYHYGRGRLHSGIRGAGSGSFGSGQAKALAVDGLLAWDHEGLTLPKPTFGNVIAWTGQIETQWSDGAKIGAEFVKEGQKHLYPTAANVTSVEQAKTLLDSYYPMTIASSWGGLMKCPVTEGVLLNRRSGTCFCSGWGTTGVTRTAATPAASGTAATVPLPAASTSRPTTWPGSSASGRRSRSETKPASWIGPASSSGSRPRTNDPPTRSRCVAAGRSPRGLEDGGCPIREV
jgi:hypothetical protein